MRIPEHYRGTIEIFHLYWKSYGGWNALRKSPYLEFSFLFSFVCQPLWWKNSVKPWYDIPISVIPNLLGFTLGGYAILLAFGSESFIENIAGPEKDGSTSPYMEVNAAFVHFIFFQTLSLFSALFGYAWEVKNPLIGFFGFTLFIYSLSSLLAACMSIFRVASWYDLTVGKKREQDKNSKE